MSKAPASGSIVLLLQRKLLTRLSPRTELGSEADEKASSPQPSPPRQERGKFEHFQGLDHGAKSRFQINLPGAVGLLTFLALPLHASSATNLGHPRLYFTTNDLPTLRAGRFHGERKLIWQNLTESSDWCLTRQP